MNPTPPPRPPGPFPTAPAPEPADDPSLDLDVRIRQVEQRLIAREEGLRRGLATWVAEWEARLAPRRLARRAGPWLLGGVGLWLLWRLVARRRPVHAPEAAAVTTPRRLARRAWPALLAGLPWERLAEMAWPLLPAPWRAGASPQRLARWLSVGLPLLGSALSALAGGAGRERR